MKKAEWGAMLAVRWIAEIMAKLRCVVNGNRIIKGNGGDAMAEIKLLFNGEDLSKGESVIVRETDIPKLRESGFQVVLIKLV